MEGHGGALFHIGPLEVTSVMTTMLGISLVLVLVCALATRNMKMIPGGLQNLVEKAVEMLDNFIGGMLSHDLKQRFFPVLATLFIFILMANYSGLLPLAGRLPGLAAPTSVLSMTAGLAVVVFCTTHYAGFKAHGGGYIKHFTAPYIFLCPLLLLEEIVRPVSLSLRLYGNIFGEETVTEQLYHLAPLGAPVAMNIFSLLMGGIQAMVFVLLACIYIEGAAGTGH